MLKASEEVRRYLSEEEVEEALKPENYIGLAPQLVERVLEKARE
ncbi:hypothetical protein [Candidatus Pyrohabitans sp.]